MAKRARLDDVRSLHNGESDREEVRDVISNRLRSWVFAQKPEDQRRFCVHGSYVGIDGALSYVCPRCVEDGYQAFG